MNETVRQINNRKSVRKFLDKPIPEEIKDVLINSCLQAPSAGNMLLYSIIDVTDQELKDKLAVSCDNQPFIAQCDTLLVFCADYKRWTDGFHLYADKVRKPASSDLIMGLVDAVIAAQNAVVAAESFGIGSCYIGDILEKSEYHRELLNLPKYVTPVCMLCFGYPTEGQKTRKKPKRFDQKFIVHENTYKPLGQDELKEMFKNGQDWNEERLKNWLVAFCERKYNSDFSEEMARSVAETIRFWNE